MNEKLTAYALNELPPDERAALEAQMQNDPALRQQAEEMKSFCSLLNEQITRSEHDTLNPEQRTQLLENFQSSQKIIRPFWRRPAFLSGFGLAAAACVALIFALHEFNKPNQDALDAIAMDSPNSGALPHGQVIADNAGGFKNEKVEIQSRVAQNEPITAPSKFRTRVSPPPLTSVFSATGNDDLSGASGLSQSSTIASPLIVSNSSTGKDGDLSFNGITKSGSGTVTLRGVNTYSDGTSVSGGMLAMNLDQSSLPAPAPSAPAPSSGPAIALAMSSASKSVLKADSAAEKKNEQVQTKSKVMAESSDKLAMDTKPADSLAAKEPMLEASGKIEETSKLQKTITIAGNNKPQDHELRREIAAAPESQPLGGAGGGKTNGSLALNTNSEEEKALYYSAARDQTRSKMLNIVNGAWEDQAPILGDILVTDGLYGRKSATRGTQTYRHIIENPFLYVAQQPLSTFSLDVDTASYANVRRFLNSNQRPPANAVRLEELINYFPYKYDAPADDKPFAVHVDIAEAPWQPLHRLARIAVKAREIKGERQPANFVFLLDVSGSMQPEERLPLIKKSLRLLVDQLRADDRVAIVTYAGNSGVALASTPGSEKEKITQAIEHLNAGGSTNGASGIRLAYEQAALNFGKERINRVILATDGDFNVGLSNVAELEKLIAEKAKSGVFLSVLGVGTDNLHDHTMQTLADRGNGNYNYLDSVGEARKVLVEQMSGTLITIAKDVKIQVEFNPAQVAAYRLVGYEKRLLAKEDFNNDKKDAGEIGAGHTVTALYEIVPANLKFPDGKPVVDDLKYALKEDAATKPSLDVTNADTKLSKIQATPSSETMTVKLRYKQPDADVSQLLEFPFTDNEKKLTDSDKEFQFAVSVAGFGMLLRDSAHAGELTWDTVRKLALSGKGPDEQGWRGEFIQLIEKARGLSENR